ncbi:PAS domain-containing protein [Lusitaniella coriacea LEGE 07157]|uniref:histidine kinase n=1 Tax=Lusitaniella coriacea LEGE 07157 TaxID=945747 RepID=A0A8J7DY50_9CYAN|nr:PAS domain-containing protein [Lusitaniella coriacea]MBE9117591.1 PAS domain-containing protein [Lusitaniella coriacea LEGE 07157]
MLEFIRDLFFSHSYMPHGQCYLWQSELIRLHVFSDGLIALAYYSIPLLLLYFVRNRTNIPFKNVFILFSLFILSCGTTHLMAIWTLWHPAYWLSGFIKAGTALVSGYTAIAIVPILPRALAIPSAGELEAANQNLEREILERKQAEANLEYQLQFDRAISKISTRFINLKLENITEGINQALQEIAEFIQADTSYIFQLSDDRATFTMTHEWVAPGQTPRIEQAKNVPYKAFPWSTSKLLNGEILHVPSIANLPEAIIDCRSWQPFNLKSLICVPMAFRDRVLGWVGFACCDKEQVWSPSSTQLLKMFAEILTNTLQRQETEEALRRLNEELESRVEERTAALKESEERLQLALEASQEGIWDWNIATGEVYLSREWLEMLDYEVGELPESFSTWEKLIHPEDKPWVMKQLDAYLKDFSVPYNFDYRMRNKAGEWQWIGNYGKVVARDERGQPLRMTGTHKDIRDRKQVEEALRESEERFRSMANSAPVLIWMSGTDAKCSFFNQIWLDFTGRTLKQEVGKGWTESVHPEDLQYCLDTYLAAFEARKSFEIEYRIRRVDGAYRWVLNSGIPRFTPQGNFTGYIGSCIDISDRRDAEQQLLQVNAELRQSNQELEQFAYVASHDLREPLRMVTSFTKLLSQRYSGRLDAEADRIIHFAVDGAIRMQALIDDLLTYSRLGRKVNLQIIDCDKVLDSVLANLKILLEEVNHAIARSPLPTLQGDRGKLVQLFQNLLSNAIKYHSERPLKINIGVREQKNSWLFWISDNGMGIAPQYQKQIFLIFQRLHTKEEYPGTGIGLAICQKIVEGHGGKIWVESQFGEGSTFYFTLPRYAQD